VRVVLFGATGMIGQGVLRECRLAADVDEVLAVGRSGPGVTDPKLRELVHEDFTDFTGVADDLTGFDACFFCLGVSSAGMNEAAYRRISYDFPLAAARVLTDRNPGLTFTYVTGAGTNEHGRAMWARVKGEAERDLIALSPTAYAFRPGFVQPTNGERSRTALYRGIYATTRPLYPLLGRLSFVTSTDRLGRAMLTVARTGWPARVLENRDINEAGAPR
jgi:uncharacterized protein YbjT (DUF2867 family)